MAKIAMSRSLYSSVSAGLVRSTLSDIEDLGAKVAREIDSLRTICWTTW